MGRPASKKGKSVDPSNLQEVIHDEDFRIVAEDAPVMLWLINPEGKVIFTNSKWKRFVGAAPGEEVPQEAWLEALHPDDRDHCLRSFENAFRTHQSFTMEYRLKRSDGQFRHVMDTGEPYINKAGRFSGFIGSSMDITDRKTSELELRRSQSELTRHNKEMQLINELNSYLQVCRSLDETHTIIEHYGSIIFSDCPGALYLFNESRNAVEAVAHWGGRSRLRHDHIGGRLLGVAPEPSACSDRLRHRHRLQVRRRMP